MPLDATDIAAIKDLISSAVAPLEARTVKLEKDDAAIKAAAMPLLQRLGGWLSNPWVSHSLAAIGAAALMALAAKFGLVLPAPPPDPSAKVAIEKSDVKPPPVAPTVLPEKKP